MSLYSRSVLDSELADVRRKIIQLSSLVDTAIERAMTALMDRQVEMARQVQEDDEQINRLRYEVEEECLLILATQQPAATDLRTVMTAVHIAVELERMGDHAAGIASLVERMQSDREIASFWKLPKMAKRARKMLGEGIEAYLQHDADLAENMMQRDDKLDKHYFLLFRSIIEEMEHTDDYIRLGTFLLWIGHNLERIGDRATNIAEQIIFMKTGKYPEIVLQP